MKRFFLLLAVLTTSMVIVSACGTYAESGKTGSPPGHVYMKEAEQSGSSLSGKIVETMNSGGYTYLCIEKDGNKTWVATPEMKVTTGEEITLQPGYEMTNFTSKTLNRTFDKIIFSNGLLSKQGAIDVKSFHGGSMGSKSTEVASTEKIKVEKAAGTDAYTVAELYQKSVELDKKNVTVRGKVVKVSSGIMRKNWIHIQDGTGDAKDGSNDIVVTTQDTASVGDIVTAKGTLYKDKDFGSGYLYKVIIEEAGIKK